MSSNQSIRPDLQQPEDPQVYVEFAARSERGLHRTANEDHYLVSCMSRNLQTLATNISPAFLNQMNTQKIYAMVVADGIGSQGAGELASKEAISLLQRFVQETPDWIMQLNDDRVDQVLSRIKERFEHVSSHLREYARQDPSLAQMKTTLTVAASQGFQLIIGHTGDSRAYLFREGKLIRLTNDQTFSQSLADSGAPEWEVQSHVLRDTLTGALGSEIDADAPEFHRYRIQSGDQVLLCSDGLTDYVSDAEIAGLLAVGRGVEATVAALVEFSKLAKSADDITIILTSYRFT